MSRAALFYFGALSAGCGAEAALEEESIVQPYGAPPEPEEPVVEEPAVEEPAVEEPVVEEPAEDPAAEESEAAPEEPEATVRPRPRPRPTTTTQVEPPEAPPVAAYGGPPDNSPF